MKKKKKKKPIKKLFIFIIIIISFILVFMRYKNTVLPAVLKIGENYAVDTINEKINTSVEKVVSELNLTSQDFFEKAFDDEEKINYFSADTILINRVCSKTAAEISAELKAAEDEKITLPIGIFSGLELFSNIGPKFTISILQAGNTLVDYETSFESQGINQINFKIWLVTKTEIDIINPFSSKRISVSRKIMLVNTVFTGTVPQTYLNMNNE